MKSVNIAELKNRLSSYLAHVRQGEEVIVCDRKLPVAKLVPFEAGDASEEDLELVAAGLMRLPQGTFDEEAFWKIPTGRVEGNLAVEALLQDREESL